MGLAASPAQHITLARAPASESAAATAAQWALARIDGGRCAHRDRDAVPVTAGRQRPGSRPGPTRLTEDSEPDSESARDEE